VRSVRSPPFTFSPPCSELIRKLENREIALKVRTQPAVCNCRDVLILPLSLQFDPSRGEAAMVKLFESMTVHSSPQPPLKRLFPYLCPQAFEPKMRPSASQVAQAVLKLIDHQNPEIFRYR